MMPGQPPAGYGAMVPAAAGMGQMMPMAGGGIKGKMRNPLITLVLAYVSCGIYAPFGMYFMLKELKDYLQTEDITPWWAFTPLVLLTLLKLPDLVVEAKRRAGVPNPQSAGLIMYLILGFYFLPKDLNEVWNPAGQFTA
jgi:hypothetical protein